MPAQPISLKRYYWRFTWVYLCLSAAMLAAVALFEWVTGSELPDSPAYSIGIMFGTAYAVMQKFVTVEGRAPDRGERWRLIGGSIASLGLITAAILMGICLVVFSIDLATVGIVLLVALMVALPTLVILMVVYGPVARKLAARLEQRAPAA